MSLNRFLPWALIAAAVAVAFYYWGPHDNTVTIVAPREQPQAADRPAPVVQTPATSGELTPTDEVERDSAAAIQKMQDDQAREIMNMKPEPPPEADTAVKPATGMKP